MSLHTETPMDVEPSLRAALICAATRSVQKGDGLREEVGGGRDRPPALRTQWPCSRPSGEGAAGLFAVAVAVFAIVTVILPRTPAESFPGRDARDLGGVPEAATPSSRLSGAVSSPARRVQPPFPAGLAPSHAGHAPSCLPIFTVSHTDAPRRVLTEREMRFCATSQPGSVRPGVHPGPPVPVNKKPMGT